MNKSIGLLEFKSIAKGIEVADEILKAADVELVMSTPICPGKYIIIISGRVGSVNTGISVGQKLGGFYLIDTYNIPNIHNAVLPALTGTTDIEKVRDIGIIETMSAISSIKMADIAVKSSNIDLIEVRIARGLGGKGFLVMTGEISSINSAVKACQNGMADQGEILCASILSSPTKDILDHVL